MSANTPERPDMDDDLDQAYARSHALADDGRGPAASVRANVLAAAREAAAQARTRIAADEGAPPPLTAVASPVAAVGRGRALAVNLSSWRVRSGAAVCAALLVALGVWRFDANHRFDGGEQVATAALEPAPPPTTRLPRELAAPPMAAASIPYLPPPVVDDPVDNKPAAAAKTAPRDRQRDLVVAQAEQSYGELRSAPQPEARTEARLSPAPAAPPVRDTANAATPAPVAAVPEAPIAQPPATLTVTAPVAPQLATLPPMPPSVVPRRLPVAPQAAPALAAAAPARRASADEVRVAAAEPGPQRVEITGSSIRRVDAADAAAPSLDALKKSKSALAGGVAARPPATTLQSAADRGDVEALKALLADPAARVDAPDPAGRTALLHAVLAQQVAAVRLLIAAGADPARADPAGLTPRAAAQAGASAEIAELLAAPR